MGGGGNRITRALLRKRAEHNESIIGTLEELALHQEELVAIDEILGTSCRKLKILYLQNNIIGKLENLHHLKDLEYLNVALNNIAMVEGLEGCEFLRKLDLTVNFVDLDALEASVDHLKPRVHLRELFLMGNPAESWSGCKNFVIASLPQLESLDGVQITRSARILADQQLPHLRLELRELAATKRAEKAAAEPVVVNTDEATPYTPEVRTAMYEELAEQKAEQEARRSHMQPRERDADREQREAVAEARRREDDGHIKQCNQGKWDFAFDDEAKPGCLLLDVAVARHLDSSLIDLDVHPTYVSVVIKSKTLRLALPCEVKADQASAQRSKTTGHLVVTMPKLDDRHAILFPNKPAKPPQCGNRRAPHQPNDHTSGGKQCPPQSSSSSSRVTRRVPKPNIGSLLLEEATKDSAKATAAEVMPVELSTCDPPALHDVSSSVDPPALIAGS